MRDSPYVYRPNDARHRGLRRGGDPAGMVIVDGEAMSYRDYRR